MIVAKYRAAGKTVAFVFLAQLFFGISPFLISFTGNNG